MEYGIGFSMDVNKKYYIWKIGSRIMWTGTYLSTSVSFWTSWTNLSIVNEYKYS